MTEDEVVGRHHQLDGRDGVQLSSVAQSCPTLCDPMNRSIPGLLFSNESTLRMRWPKYWSFSFSIIPSKVIPGLISFRMDWLYLKVIPRHRAKRRDKKKNKTEIQTPSSC